MRQDLWRAGHGPAAQALKQAGAELVEGDFSDRYEGKEIQAEIVRGFGQKVLDSGYFKELVAE